MKIAITVCNICQDPTRPTQGYVVARSGKEGEIDVCEEHGAPLEAVLKSVPRARKARTRGITVTSLDDIG